MAQFSSRYFALCPLSSVFVIFMQHVPLYLNVTPKVSDLEFSIYERRCKVLPNSIYLLNKFCNRQYADEPQTLFKK